MEQTWKTQMCNKHICIYCIGDYGLETYFKLREHGIKIDYFADRDPEKWGYALEGVYCRSYEELLYEDKENCMLIVAIKNPETLIEKFRYAGFQQVYDKETAIKILVDEPIPKVIEPLRDIEQIKQMKEKIQKMIYSHEMIYEKESNSIISDYILRHYKKKKKN